jgi:hypothetical protein
MDDGLKVEEDKFQSQGSLEPSVGRMHMNGCSSIILSLEGPCDTILCLHQDRKRCPTFRIPEIRILAWNR